MSKVDQIQLYSGPIPDRIFRGDRAGYNTFDPRLRDVEQFRKMKCLYFAITFNEAELYTLSKRRRANGTRQYSVYECRFSEIPRLAVFGTEAAARDFVSSPGQDIDGAYSASVAAMVDAGCNGSIVVRDSGPVPTELAIFATLPIEILSVTELPDVLGEPEWSPE